MFPSQRIEEQILAILPQKEWAKRRVCLAVSGGADSVALLCAFVRIAERSSLKNNLFVVTVDHGLRGAESDGDVLFVCDLARELGVDCVVRRIDSQELQEETRRQGSLEGGARTLRYRLLIDESKKRGARFLVTAHHQDDQLETLLFRLFRGSGLDGLRGAKVFRPIDESLVVVRPLLNVDRNEILRYLEALGRSYRFDSSNASSDFLRNRIRNELVPKLDEIFPTRWRGAILRTSQLADETENYLDGEVDELERNVEKARRQNALFRQTLTSLNAFREVERNELDAFEAPLEPLKEAPDEILVRFFRRVWTRKNWSLDSMGAVEWRRLAFETRERLSGSPFPGNILLSFPEIDVLRLEKRNV